MGRHTGPHAGRGNIGRKNSGHASSAAEQRTDGAGLAKLLAAPNVLPFLDDGAAGFYVHVLHGDARCQGNGDAVPLAQVVAVYPTGHEVDEAATPVSSVTS